jgi:hypothetical protein
MGWVVQVHAEIYAKEYGWNSDFEALVAEIVAKHAEKAIKRCSCGRTVAFMQRAASTPSAAFSVFAASPMMVLVKPWWARHGSLSCRAACF